MNRYMELRERHQREVNEFPLGFAFNEEQFNEMMKAWGLKPTDTDKIYKLSWGFGFVRKKDSKTMHEMFDRHLEEIARAIADDKDGTGFIYDMFSQELEDHEYGYTRDLEPTLDACGLTVREIQENKALMAGLSKALQEYEKHE